MCRMLKPFQPPSAGLPAGPIMPVSTAILAASFRMAAPSVRATTPAPRTIIGRLASLSTLAKSWLPLAICSSAAMSVPSCSHRIGQIHGRPDIGDLHAAGQPGLADAGIQHRRFPARIGADQQDGVGRFDAGDGRIEQIGLARARRSFAPSWRQSRLVTPSAVHQILQRLDLFGRGQVADNGGHAFWSRRATLARRWRQRLRPSCRPSACRSRGYRAGRAAGAQARHRRGAPCRKSIPRSLLHSGAAARASPAAARIDADVAALRIHHVDAFGLAQFPGPGVEGIGLEVSAPTGHRSTTLPDSSQAKAFSR